MNRPHADSNIGAIPQSGISPYGSPQFQNYAAQETGQQRPGMSPFHMSGGIQHPSTVNSARFPYQRNHQHAPMHPALSPSVSEIRSQSHVSCGKCILYNQ